ncbi:TPA: hypothetical protein DCL28_00535 [Candidatus Komeilibacteria bacterium]|nr:MAG: hypothetical protein A2260_03415 [Candidatus Komeilibacteria bacterium RIFOXYA2_FULL_45_9]OGY93560.1 MAG: hypothetical protein A3J95_02730 [Candidatus Komeilibacteria bacterium RIFOXYC2_FULL_45_12]HAH04032.1 hypothetical protein [Candidatus Komeilibacteria bacterium]HCC73877.1 hypothetical protein [Candidatus Komeilibacteria bacterium]
MNNSIKRGFSFGLTSGVITTLGLMVGLHSGTHLASVVISGILVIAVADSLSDALGIHMAEEFENQHTPKEIWTATAVTFLSKLLVAASFIIPILLFNLNTAIIISIAWGLSLIFIFNFLMAKQQHDKPWHAVAEHLVIAILVIIATHYLGDLLARQ